MFLLTRTVPARLGRSTGRSTEPSIRSTVSVDRCARIRARWLPMGRSTARATDCIQVTLCLFRSTGPVDRQCKFGKICCQRLVSRFAYKYPICKSFSQRFLCEFLLILWCFQSNQKKYLDSNWAIYFEFFLGFEKSKKRVFGKRFWLNFFILISSFSQGFFLWFWF